MMRFMALSIRMKILVVLILALGTSLLSYITVGTSLIVEDKASYIYEFNLAQVRSANDLIDSHIHRVRTSLGLMGRLVDASDNAVNAQALSAFYDQQRQTLANRGLMVLRPADATKFAVQKIYSRDFSELQQVLQQAGWTPSRFEQSELLTVSAGQANLLVGVRAKDMNGEPLVLITSVELKADLFKGDMKNFRLHIVDSAAKPLAGSADFNQVLQPEKVKELETALLKAEFPSGANDWSDGKQDYIVAYQRLTSAPMMVVGFVSKKESFRAAETLIKRSAVLGVSILLLAVALTLLLARGITRRLRQLGNVAQSVGEGDFSVRVNVAAGNDEIAGLGRTFNTMAGRINELMAETAEKARMGKELETAQAVQKTFFPVAGFEHPNLQLSGKALPASECAGDWWQYSQIGKYLVVSVGDVTGHGVSSALVTAAAFGAFTLAVQELKSRFEQSGEVPSIDKFVNYLNAAVRAAGGGGIDMTTVVSIIDLETGKMRLMNAAHRPPYVFRKPDGYDLDTKPTKAFTPLMGASSRALGSDFNKLPQEVEYQLKPGDVVFWYTDGLVECKNEAGEVMKKPVLMRTMASAVMGSAGNADVACGLILDEFATFLGKNAKSLEDDVTLTVALIPAEARFNN